MSLRLPGALLDRARRYARVRNIGVAAALRAIVSERLDELDQDEQLTRAERWQRDQAWASAKEIFEGRPKPVPWAELDQIHQRSLAKLRSRRKAG